MPAVQELLSSVAPDLERQVKSQLVGFTAVFVRPYLPQRWVFVTEQGTASIVVEPNGAVSVEDGAVKSPDVTVHVAYERLRIALTTRRKELVPPGATEVTPHTSKGQTAFQFLRSRLGL